MPEPDATADTVSEVAPASDGDVRIYRYLAPAVLSALALLQLFFGQFHNLTPWKGGGFGMFSTPDGPSARVVRVYLETDDREIPARMPGWIRNQEKFTRSFPAKWRLRSITEEMAAAHWHYVPDKGYSAKGVRVGPGSPDEPKKRKRAREKEDVSAEEAAAYPPVSSRKANEEPREDRVQIEPKAVRVEVWRRTYDGSTDMLSLEKIAEHRAEAPR